MEAKTARTARTEISKDAMTPRKQPTKATAPRSVVPLPLAETRRQIWEAAAELIAAGDPRDVTELLAKRFRAPHAIIARVMVLEALRFGRGSVSYIGNVLLIGCPAASNRALFYLVNFTRCG